MVLKLFTAFIVVAAILASPKHRDFTWRYRSSIYRVHWLKQVEFSTPMFSLALILAANYTHTRKAVQYQVV